MFWLWLDVGWQANWVRQGRGSCLFFLKYILLGFSFKLFVSVQGAKSPCIPPSLGNNENGYGCRVIAIKKTNATGTCSLCICSISPYSTFINKLQCLVLAGRSPTCLLVVPFHSQADCTVRKFSVSSSLWLVFVIHFIPLT